MKMEESDKVLFKFDVYYSGWEMDSKGWIMEKQDGSKYLKLTNHGEEYFGTEKELEDLIKEYESGIKNTKMAILILNREKKI